MPRSLNKILLAHYKTKLSLMLWGSSGYGKTSLVKEFAKAQGFETCILHAQYLDPLALFIPSTQEMKDLGFFKVYPSENLHRLFQSKQKTVLFLDELSRAREETFNILTELLVDRTVFGYRVPDHILIVAASNFAEEDTGVREFPDAVMQRLTHIIHAPNPKESAATLQSKLAKELVTKDPRIIRSPNSYPIFDCLKACPRQIDACGLLAESGLQGDDLADVCRGRIGIEAGADLAVRIELLRSGVSHLLPSVIHPHDFTRIAEAERKCGVLEVVSFLKEQMQQNELKPHVASYLLEHATPETCRSLQIHGFSFSYSGTPKKSNGQLFMTPQRPGINPHFIENAGKPWQWYAVRLGKLTPR